MNELQKVFQYDGRQVRTAVVDEVVWFVASDICDVLEIGNPSQTVKRLDEDEKNTLILNDGIGNPRKVVVSESGLYSMVLGSRKKEAKQFKRWVTHDVLPSIRKTGSYTSNVPQTFSEALRLAADLQEEAERNRPKVEAHDRFISGENYQTMSIAAKSLGIGRNILFRKLKQKKILMANNTPYQAYMDRGYFVVKEKPIKMGEQVINKPQTYVTPKGVDWLDKLLDEETG
ncbi:phage antirepressor [Sediminibacillus halophilus]|uniref:Phage antirepressor protein KilAC domain-containing protein n=1 Tax=Sediminibacillus halophilus TaxID=482461 RepID=A0A1G9QWR5_9BACI|nr:phage antirepressor KilAC domain-containing protein [Sediminibacillus halophilus]SDM15466.1 Phage antirepressor protein KilAC domain-containing protein [Sediminibacillus halophilus]